MSETVTIPHKQLVFDADAGEYIFGGRLGMGKRRVRRDDFHYISHDVEAGTITAEISD